MLCELGETTIEGLQSYSPFCLKVHRALRIAGLSYESRHGAPHAFKNLNPAGQVPVLLVGEREVIADSSRILARIDQLSTEAGGPRSCRRIRTFAPRPGSGRTMPTAPSAGTLVAARWADDDNWLLVREAYFKGAPWFVRALLAPRIRSRVVAGLVARDVTRAGDEACWDDFRRCLDHLEVRAPYEGFWVTRDAPSIADIALFGMLHSLRTPLTRAQAREIVLRPALTDWLDRVDALNVSRPESAAARAELTAPRGHDMKRACPSRIPTPRPSVTADVVAFTMRADDLAVLLIKRKEDPFKGCWALPGGFVNENESLERAAARELHEETGLTVSPSKLEMLGAFGDPGRDPRGHTVPVAYVTFRATETKINAGDDATEAEWISLRLLDLGEVSEARSMPPPPPLGAKKKSRRAASPGEARVRSTRRSSRAPTGASAATSTIPFATPRSTSYRRASRWPSCGASTRW